MHELSLTHSLIDTVLTEADKANAKEVRAVYVTVGSARDIVDELFDGCFKHFSRNTIAEGAELVVTRVPLTARCRECGTVYPIQIFDDKTLDCPSCGKREYDIHSGMEFFISRIEIV